MKHHPDIASEDSNREEFARVCEAYEVLSSGEVVVGWSAQQRRQAQSPAGAGDTQLTHVVLALPAAKLKGAYDLYGEHVFKSTAEGAHAATSWGTIPAARSQLDPPTASTLHAAASRPLVVPAYCCPVRWLRLQL